MPNVVLGGYLLFVVTLKVANAKFDVVVTVKEEYCHWSLPLYRSLLPHTLQEFLGRNTWRVVFRLPHDSDFVLWGLDFFFLRVRSPNLKIVYSNQLSLQIVIILLLLSIVYFLGQGAERE